MHRMNPIDNMPCNYSGIVCLCVHRRQCDPFSIVHALHRVTAILNCVPWTNSKTVCDGLKIVSVCICPECSRKLCVDMFASAYHFCTTTCTGRERPSILHRVWLLLVATVTAAAAAMLSLWLIISMCDYKTGVYSVSVGFIMIVFWSCSVECVDRTIRQNSAKLFIWNEEWRQSKYLQFSSRNPCQCM